MRHSTLIERSYALSQQFAGIPVDDDNVNYEIPDLRGAHVGGNQLLVLLRRCGLIPCCDRR